MEAEPDQQPADTSQTSNGKKQSLLSEALVTGLLKNINDKVHNKLDDEAQSELAGIVSSKVKEAGMEAGISFDCEPGSEHVLASAGKRRVSPPRSQKSRPPTHRDSLEEDFESLLRDEDFHTDEEAAHTEGSNEEDREKSSDSYLDDFEALLAESAGQEPDDCDKERSCDIEADFDALIEKENLVVQNSHPATKIESVPGDLKEDTEEDPREQDEVSKEIVEADEENTNDDHNRLNSSENPEADLTASNSVAGEEDKEEEELSECGSCSAGPGMERSDQTEEPETEPRSGVKIDAGELESFDVLIQEKGEETSNHTGKKVIVPTMEILDQETLDKEIREDSREAELLIQLKHLSGRVEAQDTLLAELKEENTVLKIQNQNLVESLTRASARPSLFRKSSKEYQSLEYQDLDETTERKKLFLLEQELEDQKEVNKQLKAYVGDVLINIIVQNPDILEKKTQQ